MVRRSFRFGLRLGLLFGIGFAVFKTVQSRRTGSEPPAPEPWKPITDNLPRPTPAPATPTPAPAPEPAPAVQPEPAPPVDEVGEPIQEPTPPEPAPQPEPAAAPVAKSVKKAAKKATKAAKKKASPAPVPAFVLPEDGICPPTHPIKAKLVSRLFHAPGMFAYPRTRPDRCYSSEEAAVADGLTRAKR